MKNLLLWFTFVSNIYQLRYSHRATEVSTAETGRRPEHGNWLLPAANGSGQTQNADETTLDVSSGDFRPLGPERWLTVVSWCNWNSVREFRFSQTRSCRFWHTTQCKLVNNYHASEKPNICVISVVLEGQTVRRHVKQSFCLRNSLQHDKRNRL